MWEVQCVLKCSTLPIFEVHYPTSPSSSHLFPPFPSFPSLFQVPLVVASSTQQSSEAVIMRQKEQQFSIPLAGADDWVKINAGQKVGPLYSTHYVTNSLQYCTSTILNTTTSSSTTVILLPPDSIFLTCCISRLPLHPSTLSIYSTGSRSCSPLNRNVPSTSTSYSKLCLRWVSVLN